MILLSKILKESSLPIEPVVIIKIKTNYSIEGIETISIAHSEEIPRNQLISLATMIWSALKITTIIQFKML